MNLQTFSHHLLPRTRHDQPLNVGRKSRESTDPCLPLYNLLWERYSASENYHEQKFICMETVKQELDYNQIWQWSKNHPLHRQLERYKEDPLLINSILTGSRLLFAMLVLGRLEYLCSILLSHGLCDETLFDSRLFLESCLSAKLDERERRALADSRKRVGALLRNDIHQIFPKGTVLPYRNVNHPKEDRFGGFGVVRRVEVAAGHLRGFDEVINRRSNALEYTNELQTIVALKQIRPMDNENRTEWEQIYREVETLQRMRHRNIIPLLASYYLDATDSSDRPLRTLYLLFPWADMDLELWMNSPHVPTPIQTLSRRERQAYIYRSISGLVSGLSYLHRESGGLITSHHDLKPSNVLVVGQDFKIADLGRSHLRPIDGGSETEGANGLGTYEYQPPEYWQNNGSRAKVKHGRAFDIWAMGCMLIELATLIVHDWGPGMISNFRKERAENRSRDRPRLAESRKHEDSSFHNNWSVVENWIIELRRHAASTETLEDTLDVAQEMLAHDPRSRSFSWEAEIDLYEIQNPGDVQLEYVGQGSLCVKPPWEVYRQGNVPNGAQTPLHRAALKEDKTRLMELLRLGWPIHVQDEKGNTSLDIVKRSTDKYFRESFALYFGQGIAATRKNDGFSLIEAAETGNTTIAKTLLDKGVSPLLVNLEGRSALFLAVIQGHNSMISTLLESKIQEQLFLKDKVSGDTVLHQAATLGHENTVKQLLLYSPVLEDRQHEGKTALFLAAESSHEKTIEVLLDHEPKVQVFTQSNSGDTPIHRASIHGHKALELLLNSEDSNKCLEHKNQLGQTPVWLALRHKNFEGFRRLKERGASLTVADNNKDNLLHIVAHEQLDDFLNQSLHAFDASKIEERNRWNDTPLTIAERNGNSDIASLLKSYYLGKIKPNEGENLNENSTELSQPRLFYTLGSESKWIREASGGYWRHLTYKSYELYEQIYTSAGKGQKFVQCKPTTPPPLLETKPL